MFRGNRQPVQEETEIAPTSATPPNVNPDMVRQLTKVARHAQEIEKDVEVKSKTNDQHRQLTVGPGIRLKGEITDCDTLVIEGHVEVSAKTRVVKIAKTGTLVGDIEVKTAEVSGSFDGSLDANERLMIRSSGRVSGKIRYGDIEIESGGRISGDVEAKEEARDISPIAKGDMSDSMAS